MKKNEKSYINASRNDREINDRRKNIGQNLSFAGAEAYKLLRTNLILSMAADIPCKVIGVTSSLRGEGKSTTSINLAYSLAEIGKRVLLVEADMRIPYMAKTLNIVDKPGLSNFLAGQVPIKEAARAGVLQRSLYVVPAGDIPPNPAELLSSSLMAKAIDGLSSSFDYIILDLPPIMAVSDSLAISQLLSGMIVVVRENYCDQRALSDTMRQLEYLHVKVLGFVVNASEARSKSYGKYKNDKYGYDYYQQPKDVKQKDAPHKSDFANNTHSAKTAAKSVKSDPSSTTRAKAPQAK